MAIPLPRRRSISFSLDEDRQETLSLFLSSPLVIISLVIVIGWILVAIFARQLAPAPGDAFGDTHLSQRLLAPSREYPMGTDGLGRDVLSRLIMGSRPTLVSGLIPIIVSLLIGVPAGAIAGYFGGRTDSVIMRMTDMLLALPRLVLAIAIGAALGPSLTNAMLALIVVWTPHYVRSVYGQTLAIREEAFVETGRALGVPPWKIIQRHVLPNCASTIIVMFTMDLGFGILTMASLGFVGVGAQPPSPEWGLSVSYGRGFMPNWWWISFFPGMAIFSIVLAFNLLGDGLRDALDPRRRK